MRTNILSDSKCVPKIKDPVSMKKLFACMSLLFSVSFSTQALVILQYHHIDDSTPAVTSTRVDDFMAHMELLEKEGMHIIDLKDALEKVQRNEALQKKLLLLTLMTLIPLSTTKHCLS